MYTCMYICTYIHIYIYVLVNCAVLVIVGSDVHFLLQGVNIKQKKPMIGSLLNGFLMVIQLLCITINKWIFLYSHSLYVHKYNNHYVNIYTHMICFNNEFT